MTAPGDAYLPPEGGAPHRLPAAILEAERRQIARRRATYGLALPDPRADPATGLALSGGGIRSATFSLGVLQALAEADLLKRFDYLSTVSGGGYLGTSLVWWASGQGEHAFGLSPWAAEVAADQRFPYVAREQLSPDAPPPSWETEGDPPTPFARLDHLRRHGRYLTPGAGITLLSLLSVVIRGSVIQLAFWLPMLTLLLAVLGLLLGGPATPPLLGLLDLTAPVAKGGATLALLLALLGAAYWWRTRHGPEPSPGGFEWLIERPRPASVLAILVVVVPGLILLWLAPHPEWRGLTALLGVAGMMLVAFGLLALLYGVLSGSLMLAEHWPRGGNRRHLHLVSYDMRRLWETWAGFGAGLTLALALIGSMPLVGEWLKLASPVAGGVGALLSGMLLAFFAFSRSRSMLADIAPGRQPWRSSVMAAAMLLIGVLLLAHELADGLVRQPSWLLLLLPAVAAFGLLCHLNHISVHRYYRDRLMEAFMPGVRQTETATTGPVPNAADTLSLAECTAALARVPYPLINTNLVLVNASDARRRDIGGDNFVLSPLYCGSSTTGWRRTDAYPEGNVTLATAMAISGAAANPNTGFGGVGTTRSRPVALAMSLLNLRLGYWVPHPAPPGKRWQSLPPNQFWPGLCAFLPWSHREDARYHELSDGGHFENLGLFELLRRRTRLVLVVDGSQDEGSRFASVQLALARCRELLGVRVTFDELDDGRSRGSHPEAEGGGPLDCLIPREPLAYPPGARLARCAHLSGTIRYPAEGGQPAACGRLLLIKSTLIPGLPLGLLGYRDRCPSFPDEPTSDQFFSEEQFEAYRELGLCIGRALLADDRVGLAADLVRLAPSA